MTTSAHPLVGGPLSPAVVENGRTGHGIAANSVIAAAWCRSQNAHDCSAREAFRFQASSSGEGYYLSREKITLNLSERLGGFERFLR
jgi:hypothetical protein